MKFVTGLAALATAVAAAPSASPSPLDVKLEMAGNSIVKATITNNGKQDLKVFKPNSILDNAPIEKATIVKDNKAVDFKGVRLRVSPNNIANTAFEHIPAGKSVDITFNVAETHDLSSGGSYDIITKGVLNYANADDNKLIGSVPFESKVIKASVDGVQASVIHEAHKVKRTSIQNDCSGGTLQAVSNAANNCVSLAQQASQVASSGSAAKMQEFFKSSSSSVRQQVANVLNRVVSECANNGGASQTYCTDVGGYCGGNILAYTVPSQSYIVYCALYFNDLPPLTSSCHQQDQATTNLHETTHLSEVAGTQDLGYGYDNIRTLSTQDSLNNADSYAVFANSIYAGC